MLKRFIKTGLLVGVLLAIILSTFLGPAPARSAGPEAGSGSAAALPAAPEIPDATFWQADCVQCTRLTSSALAFDPANRPHVLLGGDLLRHAFFDGAAWQFETLPFPAAQYDQVSLAIDSTGVLHAAYRVNLNSQRYALSFGVSWTEETISNAFGAGLSTLVLDHQGRPHLAIQSTTQIAHAFRNSGVWRLEFFANMPSSGVVSSADDAPVIAVGLQDNDPAKPLVLIAYRNSSNFSASLLQAVSKTSSGGISTPQTIFSGFVAQLSLAIDPQGIAYLAFRPVTSSLMLARSVLADPAGSWQVQTVLQSGDISGPLSLALDSAGLPHLAFYESSGPLYQQPDRLLLAHPIMFEPGLSLAEAIRWQFEAVDIPPVGQPGAPSLVLDRLGELVLLLRHASSGLPLLARRSGQGWQTNAILEGPLLRAASLKFDSFGAPQIASFAGGSLMYLVWNGSDWDQQFIHPEHRIVPNSLAFALDAADQPRFIYQNSRNGDVVLVIGVGLLQRTLTLLTRPAGSFPALYNPLIMVDKQGATHILFHYGSSSSATVKYFVVDDTFSVRFFDLITASPANRGLAGVVDKSGDLHVVHYSTSTASLAHLVFKIGATSGTFTSFNVPLQTTSLARYPVLAYSPDAPTPLDRLHLVYVRDNGNTVLGGLEYRFYGPVPIGKVINSWPPALDIASFPAQAPLALQITPDGQTLHAAFRFNNGFLAHLSLSTLNSSIRPTSEVVDSQPAGFSQPLFSLALDPAGNPAILYNQRPMVGGNTRSTLGGVERLMLIRRATSASFPAPVAEELSPSGVVAGISSLNLRIFGRNFVPGAVLRVNGGLRTSRFVSPSELNVSLGSADLATPGSATVTVENPGPGGGLSNPLVLTLSTATTGVTSLSQPSGSTWFDWESSQGAQALAPTTTFTLTWTHPTLNWRALTSLDFRLTDGSNTPVWLRFNEDKGAADMSTFSILNGLGDVITTTLPGAPSFIETDTYILDMSGTTFQGSGTGPEDRSLTIIVRLQFKTPALGSYRVEAQPLGDNEEPQALEVIGDWQVRRMNIVLLPLLSR